MTKQTQFKTWSRILLVAAIPILTCPPGRAGTLHEVWRVDLGKVYRTEGARALQMPVRHAGFSPDGKRVAVVVNRYGGPKRLPDALFIVDVANPTSGLREYDTDSRSVGEESTLVDFSWSPSGDFIDSAEEVLRLADGSSCRIPQFGGFVNDEEILASIPVDGSDSQQSRFGIYDPTCHLKNSWDSEAMFLRAISPERRIAFISKLGPPGKELIVLPEKGTVLQSWDGTERSTARFVNGGRQMCGAVPAHTGIQATLACWDTEFEDRIAMAPANGGQPFATSSGSTRVVFSDYLYVPTMLREDPLNIFKDCVIWDFKTGRKVATWRPSFHKYLGNAARSLSYFAKFAISPNGENVIQAGDGIVTYFHIQE